MPGSVVHGEKVLSLYQGFTFLTQTSLERIVFDGWQKEVQKTLLSEGKTQRALGSLGKQGRNKRLSPPLSQENRFCSSYYKRCL